MTTGKKSDALSKLKDLAKISRHVLKKHERFWEKKGDLKTSCCGW
jgi:hypothetical protein